MAYTPPDGDKALLNFTGGPYTPPVGDKVALNFGEGGGPVGDTQYVFPAAWVSSAFGDAFLTGDRITPTGWDSSVWGTASLVNAAHALYPGGIAPPPPTGNNEFRQVPSPWVSFWTRTIQLETPSRGIPPPAWPNNHVIAFEVQFLDLAGRGIDSARYGTAHRIEFTSRTVFPVSISSMVFGSALIARVQVVSPEGWENATQFGDAQLDINLQRILLVGHGIPAPAITDQHHVRNEREFVLPQGWYDTQFNFPVVYNLKQEIFVSKYADDGDPTSWPQYYPFVENHIRYLGGQGWMSSRFSLIGTLVENGARAVYPTGWDSFAWGEEGFIAHYTRHVAPEGWDSFYSTHFHVAYNNAALVRPLGWESSVFGRPDPVLNLNRTVKHHTGPADGFYGTAFVAYAIRSVAPNVFIEPYWPIPEVRHNPHPIAPVGIPIPPATAPHVYEHFNVLGPTSINVHSVPWVGEPFVRNRNMTVAVYPSDQALYGRPTVSNYNTHLTVGAGDLSLWGPVLIAYRTKEIRPAPISLPVFPVLHRIRNDMPDPPAQQLVVVPTFNRNPNGTYGIVPNPTMNYHSVFPEGFRSSEFGGHKAENNGIRVPSMVNVDNFGYPTMIGTQYAYPTSIPRSIELDPTKPAPATYGDSDDYWTKNKNLGYEWPRLSPHMVYAPRGDMATGQAIENNPPYPEPNYHAIDGTMAAGYANSRYPFFGNTWVSHKNRVMGPPVPNHSNPNTDRLSPSSRVGTEATVIHKQRWLFPEGIRSMRFGRVVFWGVPQYINLDVDNNGIRPGDWYNTGGQNPQPPSIHTVFHKPEFHRTLPIPGTNFLLVGQHEVQNQHREIYPTGINHRGNPQQGMTSPWGVPLVGFPREYEWGGYDFTLWGDAWFSHYTRYLGAQGWRSSTLEDYPISGFNDRMRVRHATPRLPVTLGETLRVGMATVDFGTRSVLAHGFSGYNAGGTVVTSSCVILPAGWDSSEYGDIDEWEAGVVKPHGDDLSTVGTPKLRHPVRPASVDDGGVGQVRVGSVVYVFGMPPIGFDGPSVTDPFGCSTRVVSPLPVLSQEFVPLPVVT
jgi:hypothetical protein